MTLGPKRRNVVLDKSYGAPRMTKDFRVTVAKEIELDDKFENMGAQMKVREVASKVIPTSLATATTTATVLAQAIVKEGSEEGRGRGHEPDGSQTRHRPCGRSGG